MHLAGLRTDWPFFRERDQAAICAPRVTHLINSGYHCVIMSYYSKRHVDRRGRDRSQSQHVLGGQWDAQSQFESDVGTPGLTSGIEGQSVQLPRRDQFVGNLQRGLVDLSRTEQFSGITPSSFNDGGETTDVADRHDKEAHGSASGVK